MAQEVQALEHAAQEVKDAGNNLVDAVCSLCSKPCLFFLFKGEHEKGFFSGNKTFYLCAD
jgi:hypothetical protein